MKDKKYCDTLPLMWVCSDQCDHLDNPDDLDNDGDHDHGEDPGGLVDPDWWSVQRLSCCKSFNAMQCNVIQCNPMQSNATQHHKTMQHNTVYCNIMQCHTLQWNTGEQTGEQHYAMATRKACPRADSPTHRLTRTQRALTVHCNFKAILSKCSMLQLQKCTEVLCNIFKTLIFDHSVHCTSYHTIQLQ